LSGLCKLPIALGSYVIDDGSTDESPTILKFMTATIPELRILTLIPNAGQSAAFGVGFRNAIGATIITMDADGQNAPVDGKEKTG